MFRESQAEIFAQRTFLGTHDKGNVGKVNDLYFIQRYFPFFSPHFLVYYNQDVIDINQYLSLFLFHLSGL